MTTTQSNRLIAEFMGGLYGVDTKGRECIDFFSGVVLRNRIRIEHLKYHSSWDWLLSVWKKLQHIGADRGTAHERFWNKFHNGIDYGDINKCYQAVVDELSEFKSLGKI